MGTDDDLARNGPDGAAQAGAEPGPGPGDVPAVAGEASYPAAMGVPNWPADAVPAARPEEHGPPIPGTDPAAPLVDAEPPVDAAPPVDAEPPVDEEPPAEDPSGGDVAAEAPPGGPEPTVADARPLDELPVVDRAPAVDEGPPAWAFEPPAEDDVPRQPAAGPESGAGREAAFEAPAWPLPPSPTAPEAVREPVGPERPVPGPRAGVPANPAAPAAEHIPDLPPVPRPTRASRRSGATATPAPAGPRTRAADRAGGQGSPGRRRGRILLAALLAVLVLAGAAFATQTYLDHRSGDPTRAQSVPDAVLPDLSDPAPVLAGLSADAPVPDPTVLAGILTPLLDAPVLGTGLSAQVVDVATGEVLFDRDAADPSTPASTAKLLTALAVLTSLDPAGTLPTTVVAGAAPGEVVLVGGGDPTLSTTDPSQAYPGAATVADLAAQVQQQLGGTAVTRVVVDTSLFTGPLTAPGWQPDDAPSTYAAPVTAAAVDGARVDPDGSQRSGAPGTDAGQALAAALGAPGADVVPGAAPPGARTLGTVQSAPVERLVEQALTASDNLLAESLARHVAIARGLPASFAGAAQAITAAIGDAGLDTTGLSLVDASGLSQVDLVPARLLVDVVRAASDGTVPAAAGLLSGLPVAGYNGTLAGRAADGDGIPGAVRAKTGTLLAVNDLAGTVLTADGRLLAFAVLADGAAGSLGATETALDVVAAALAGCGCR